ncbi:MAG: hypothetical protein LBQ06_03850 [Frankiaceae bacterium]|nr:hypothetical protein [Frankiaceae bacterium]
MPAAAGLVIAGAALGAPAAYAEPAGYATVFDNSPQAATDSASAPPVAAPADSAPAPSGGGASTAPAAPGGTTSAAPGDKAQAGSPAPGSPAPASTAPTAPGNKAQGGSSAPAAPSAGAAAPREPTPSNSTTDTAEPTATGTASDPNAGPPAPASTAAATATGTASDPNAGSPDPASTGAAEPEQTGAGAPAPTEPANTEASTPAPTDGPGGTDDTGTTTDPAAVSAGQASAGSPPAGTASVGNALAGTATAGTGETGNPATTTGPALAVRSAKAAMNAAGQTGVGGAAPEAAAPETTAPEAAGAAPADPPAAAQPADPAPAVDPATAGQQSQTLLTAQLQPVAADQRGANPRFTLWVTDPGAVVSVELDQTADDGTLHPLASSGSAAQPLTIGATAQTVGTAPHTIDAYPLVVTFGGLALEPGATYTLAVSVASGGVLLAADRALIYRLETQRAALVAWDPEHPAAIADAVGVSEQLASCDQEPVVTLPEPPNGTELAYRITRDGNGPAVAVTLASKPGYTLHAVDPDTGQAVETTTILIVTYPGCAAGAAPADPPASPGPSDPAATDPAADPAATDPAADPADPAATDPAPEAAVADPAGPDTLVVTPIALGSLPATGATSQTPLRLGIALLVQGSGAVALGRCSRLAVSGASARIAPRHRRRRTR